MENERKRKGRLRWEGNLAPLGFLAALTAFFYWRVLAGLSVFVFVDASRFFYPFWKWGASVWGQGLVPLWNPDAQFGFPYFADPQMACAYPVVPLFYLFLSPTNAFGAVTILHHLWALAGFWILARYRGFSPRVSLWGSLVFGFSLHLVCSSWTPVALIAISWIPWVFLAADRVFEKKDGGFLGLSFAWAMQLSAGYPVLAYLTGLALGLHYGWRSFQFQKETREHWIKKIDWIFPFGMAAGTALAYNLVWGLPFAGLFRQSNYGEGAGKFHALNGWDLATAFSPFAQGHPLGADYHGPHYWVSTFFVGLPPLCLLLWGGIRGVFRKTSGWLFFLFLILSLGENLGLASWLKIILPGYFLVVHSGFWISLLAFWAALLSMESLEFFAGGKNQGAAVWAGGVVAVYGASIFLGRPLQPLLFGFSFFLSLGAVFAPKGFFRWVCLWAAFGLSLGPAVWGLNILLDRSYYDQPPALLASLGKPGRFFFTPPYLTQASRLQGVNMESAYEAAKQDLYPDWPLAYARETAPVYNTLRLESSFAWTLRAFQFSQAHSRRVLDFLNIRYLFGKNSFKDFKPVGDSAFVFENPSPGPEWFSVREAFAAGPALDGDFAAADRLSMDYRKDCWIADPSKAGKYGGRTITEDKKGPNRLELTAEGKGTALLASSETNDPGWKVRVEGKERPVEWINHAFRGVLLQDGETHVVFSYEPVSFRLGLFFALLTCGLWGALWLKGRVL